VANQIPGGLAAAFDGGPPMRLGWPHNARTAVSFTYDDGHPSGIDLVAPDLEKAGFRGTFFLTPAIFDAPRRIAGWRKLASVGHEIANHTWDHPCEQLPLYDAQTFAAEQISKTEEWLNDNIGFDEERTYAYICGELALGAEPGAEARYRELVQRTFLAARAGDGGPSSASEASSDPFGIAASAATWANDNPDRAIAYIESATRIRGGWAVLAFHQITTGAARAEIQTSRHVHHQIIDYVAEQPDRFWVAPFRDVYRMAIKTPLVPSLDQHDSPASPQRSLSPGRLGAGVHAAAGFPLSSV
jgi:peptidoglycan/xylan/chitin deacetylase (PgdA/CDA1 family)